MRSCYRVYEPREPSGFGPPNASNRVMDAIDRTQGVEPVEHAAVHAEEGPRVLGRNVTLQLRTRRGLASGAETAIRLPRAKASRQS